MRDEGEISSRLDELLARRLKQMRTEFLSQEPRNCAFNTRFRVKGQGQVGFCQNPMVLNKLGAKVFVCHESDTARQCRVYRCRNTEDSVKQEFDAILRSPERCGEKFPKVAMLIWVIQNFVSPTRGRRLGQSLSRLGKAIVQLIFFRWW